MGMNFKKAFRRITGQKRRVVKKAANRTPEVKAFKATKAVVQDGDDGLRAEAARRLTEAQSF